MHDLARDWLKARGLYEDLYTEWSIRELSEIIYVSWKSRPALLSNKPFFAAYTNLFRKVVVGLDFERISHSFSYLPFSYVFLLLHILRRNDPQEYRSILKAWDVLEATAQPQRYLKLGKLRLVHVNTEDALLRSAIGDIDRSTDFFSRVTHSSCSEPYPDEPGLQPAFFENGTVTLLPPVTLASGSPAVASMTLVADPSAKSLHFMVNTFQPERAKEISVVARMTQDSVESRIQINCTLPQPLWYDLMSIDLSGFDLSKPLVLTLFAVGDGTFPMHYTGVRVSHFQFV